MPFENPVFRPQSQGGQICQAGPGILNRTNEAPGFGRQKDGILRGTNEAARFGKPPKGNQMENKAKRVLKRTNEAPSTLH